MTDNYSKEKNEGYTGRGVGYGCLLSLVGFEIIQTGDSKYKKIEV